MRLIETNRIAKATPCLIYSLELFTVGFLTISEQCMSRKLFNLVDKKWNN